MPLSENTKNAIWYYRYLHEKQNAWDKAMHELSIDRKKRRFTRLALDLLQSMNGVFMVDYDSTVTSVVGTVSTTHQPE